MDNLIHHQGLTKPKHSIPSETIEFLLKDNTKLGIFQAKTVIQAKRFRNNTNNAYNMLKTRRLSKKRTTTL